LAGCWLAVRRCTWARVLVCLAGRWCNRKTERLTEKSRRPANQPTANDRDNLPNCLLVCLCASPKQSPSFIHHSAFPLLVQLQFYFLVVAKQSRVEFVVRQPSSRPGSLLSCIATNSACSQVQFTSRPPCACACLGGKRNRNHARRLSACCASSAIHARAFWLCAVPVQEFASACSTRYVPID
jgi:hypothetical protein